MAPCDYPLGKNTLSLDYASVKQRGKTQLGLVNLIFIDVSSLDLTKFIIYQEEYSAEKGVGNK